MTETKRNGRGPEMAVLMAAGLGSRMLPLTEKVPKPLVTVGDMPLIETMIRALRRRGVQEICVVTGYRKEMFGYLAEKYEGLMLIENREYREKNNLSSLYAVCDRLKGHDCFICEADIYVRDPDIFRRELTSSCYFAKKISGYSGDWIFETRDGRITGIRKGGTASWQMAGAAYLLRQDLELLRKEIEHVYPMPEAGGLFWDEVLGQLLDRIHVSVSEIGANDLIEIDTLDELADVRQFINQRKAK